jgi:hypothetical protein
MAWEVRETMDQRELVYWLAFFELMDEAANKRNGRTVI